VPSAYRGVADLAIRDWGEELVVAYSGSTARTHLLSRDAIELLRDAQAEPVEAPDEGIEPELAAVVEGLVQAGLLQPEECPRRR
jgi:hypothetical protein